MYTQTIETHDYSELKGNRFMTGSANIAPEGEEGHIVAVASRFGEVQVDLTKTIAFPKGLLGMPDRFRFALADFPTANMQQFKLLQSLDDVSLSFITLPLDVKNNIVDEADIVEAVGYLGIPLNEMALLLIVSVHRSPEGVKISVNARAPLFIDAARKTGIQHVFSHDKYKVQHLIS